MNQFTVGQTYSTRFICDHNSIYTCKVVSRTAKTVVIEDHAGTRRCKIHEYDGSETIFPKGKYSMCLTIKA